MLQEAYECKGGGQLCMAREPPSRYEMTADLIFIFFFLAPFLLGTPGAAQAYHANLKQISTTHPGAQVSLSKVGLALRLSPNCDRGWLAVCLRRHLFISERASVCALYHLCRCICAITLQFVRAAAQITVHDAVTTSGRLPSHRDPAKPYIETCQTERAPEPPLSRDPSPSHPADPVHPPATTASHGMLPSYASSGGSKMSSRHHSAAYSNGYPRGNTFEISPHRFVVHPSPSPASCRQQQHRSVRPGIVHRTLLTGPLCLP